MWNGISEELRDHHGRLVSSWPFRMAQDCRYTHSELGQADEMPGMQAQSNKGRSMTVGQMVLLVRRKGTPETAWRDIEMATLWSNGDGEIGAECRDRESIRRFLSAAARAGDELELRMCKPRWEKTRIVLVSRYMNRGANRTRAGVRSYVFCALDWPTHLRFVTVKMISN